MKLLCVCCAILPACGKKEEDLIQVPETPMPAVKPYKLCAEKDAAFSLQVDFEIVGVGKDKRLYHFPHRFSDSDFFISESLKTEPFGAGGKNVLSCGLSRVDEDRVLFLISCTNTKGENRREVVRNVNIPYEKPVRIQTDELVFTAKWISRKER